MRNTQRRTNLNIKRRALSLLLVAIMVFGMLPETISLAATSQGTEVVEANTADATVVKSIVNGSFETLKGYNSTQGYQQMDMSGVSPWKPSGVAKKIEILKSNTKYLSKLPDGVDRTIYPTEGVYAAELNAEEESSLYQIVNTLPDSQYLWGLDHRGRYGVDTMALVIGPNQQYEPTKNIGSGYDKWHNYHENSQTYGRDQLMQMIDWAGANGYLKKNTYTGIVSNGEITPNGEPQTVTIYSKKFGANGSFQSNADGQAFSLTPSDTYSEKWCIWIITTGMEAWQSYGSNAYGNSLDGIMNEYGTIYADVLQSSKLGKYFYNVPDGQTKSLFAFVPIDTAAAHEIKSFSDGTKGETGDLTIGNLIDNINFDIYNPILGTSTNFGTGSVFNTSADASIEVVDKNNPISSTNSIKMYTQDGCDEFLVSHISGEDDDHVDFSGLLITKNIISNDGTTNVVQEFYSAKNKVVDSTVPGFWGTGTPGTVQTSKKIVNGDTIEKTYTPTIYTVSGTLEDGTEYTVQKKVTIITTKTTKTDGTITTDTKQIIGYELAPYDIFLKISDEGGDDVAYVFELHKIECSFQ